MVDIFQYKRFNSQERENSVKRTSCFPPIGYAREESQMPLSRSSTNIIRKWNPASIPDHKCQINEELEHRMTMMETSLNKFGMILDSVQSDVMQISKGTKEVSLEMEAIRQKLVGLDTSLQLMIKGQDDTKVSINGSLISISQQLSKDIFQDKLQQIFLVLSALPHHMEASVLKLQSDLCTTFTKELQASSLNQKTFSQNSPSIMILPAKVSGSHSTPQKKPKLINNLLMPGKACGQSTMPPKIEMGSWNSVKTEKATIAQREIHKEQKRKGCSPIHKEKQCSVIIESDEEIDGVFSCLMDGNQTGIGDYTVDQATVNSERILRKARRRKRKHSNVIIIN
ncbi:putative recombination initiation defects 3 isoform X2 [Mercurialis annua]|uniref:putative recombination initiation defects 3 isoform X2 n=1 Tax=Mercurialis annua TaxID=3986 RepID=UPI00215F58D0|nr:putative recombination initiation defects 3 isoform X2 [Mercurialis annua]